MTTPEEAIQAIHHLARIESDYNTALNLGRGMKQHTRNMERQRSVVFQLIVGRKPTTEEKEKLHYGDA